MNHDDSRGLLQGILGIFARKPSNHSKPVGSLKSKTLDAWVRADAYLQHETNDFDQIDSEQIARTLRTLEDLVQYDSDPETDSDLYNTVPYPKLRAVRNITQHPSHDAHRDSSPNYRIGKRKREKDAILDELSHLETESKKRRVLPREELSMEDEVDDPEADSAILRRKHSLSLHQGLRRHWSCICQRCSGLSVRISLPRRKKGSGIETCFEVFFGVRSRLAIEVQEAVITVKDMQNNNAVSTSALVPNVLSDFAHICKCVTESLDQRNCLHLLLEDGSFKRLRPQPKTFGDFQLPRTVSLSALFTRQQELSGGQSALPLKGKRILAFSLATALLPFLETPWVQPSFDHSKIRFFQPLQDGDLPNITKPFLSLEQVPTISANDSDTENGQTETCLTKHMVHPNASVLALGILLCELHYCLPVESWRHDAETTRNVNTDYYTSLEILKNLEVDAGVDYYLATKACLQWEYYPTGELASFDSATVQRLFYQNVVKRLESEIFKSWRLSLEDLNPLDSRENELCWGVVGREVVRRRMSGPSAMERSDKESTNSSRAASSMPSLNLSLHDPNLCVQLPTRLSKNLQTRSQAGNSSAHGLYLFDACHQAASGQQTGLSERWMNGLMTSVDHHVDPFNDAVQPHVTPTNNVRMPFKPVRIAVLDSGFDPGNPLLRDEMGQLDPRIKGVHNFIQDTEPFEIQDEVGHGTHALGLLLRIATCAEIYVARVAKQDTLGRCSYDAIAKAINHAVSAWDVDIISMSFGIREYHEPMTSAISNALHNQTLMFAAASNDGANLGRAFPAKYPSVFCIHSTDGNGNPSAFNPTADERDVNFSLLGEDVRSHWPAGKNGHNDIVNVMSGTSVATPIAAGIAASVLSFVRQQECGLPDESDLLGPWLKDLHSMDAVLKSMVRQRRGAGYDYITPHQLLDPSASREHVYSKIKDIKRHMYD